MRRADSRPVGLNEVNVFVHCPQPKMVVATTSGFLGLTAVGPLEPRVLEACILFCLLLDLADEGI